MTVRVDWRASCNLTGTVVSYLAVPLLLPLAIALYYRETVVPFLATILIALAVGIALRRLERTEMGSREAFLMVSLTWLVASMIGALPYVIAGEGAIAHPVNALFESMSGFSTTGATVIEDLSFETHSRSILMWRQLSQWLGGMGIVVIGIAILSQLSIGGTQLMEAEVSGHGVTKLSPRISETARILVTIYVGFTVVHAALLYGLHLVGLAPNMTPYNVIAHCFTAISTSGFSPEARSIEAFSGMVQWTMVLFMLIGATNFALLWRTVGGNPTPLVDNEEFRAYVFTVTAVAAAAIAILFATGGAVNTGFEPIVREGVFQAVSMVTTTGYANVDFNLWPTNAKIFLFVAMFLGGSSGSTTCSIMMMRWIVVVKSLRGTLFTLVHPEAIRPIRFNGRPLDESTVRDVFAFVLLTIVLFGLSTLFIALDAARVGLEISEFEAMGVAAATFLNIGPAFGIAGPMESYGAFPDSSKLFMVALMWMGRLEILSVLVLLTPAYWRS